MLRVSLILPPRRRGGRFIGRVCFVTAMTNPGERM